MDQIAIVLHTAEFCTHPNSQYYCKIVISLLSENNNISAKCWRTVNIANQQSRCHISCSHINPAR